MKKVLTGTLLGVLAFAALSVYGDARQLVGHLTRYDFRAFVLGLALATSNYALRFLRWQYYLHRLSVRVPWSASLRIFIAGFVMSISPGKVGEVLKSALLAEQFDISAARTAPIVVAERLTDLFALVLLVALGSRTFAQGTPIAVGGGAAVLLLWLLCSWPWLADRVIRAATVVPLFARIEPRLREAFEALRTVVGPGPLAFATVLATLSWFLECLALRTIAEGFEGVHLEMGSATFAYAAPTILGALAMLPGGLFVTEAGMTGLLQSVGGSAMTPTVATGTTLLVRLATLWWAVALGLFALLLQRRVVAAHLRAEPTGASSSPPL